MLWKVWLLLCGLCIGTASAADLAGETLRITGVGSGSRIEARRLQLRTPEDDATKGQVAGGIEALDRLARRFRIGPVEIRWNDDTAFKEIEAARLVDGLPVRVSGRATDNGVLAHSIQPASALPEGTLQITGLVTRDDSSGSLRVLGQTLHSDLPGYNRLDSLTQRQDSRRPEQPFGFDLLGRRAQLTGEYVLSFRDRDNLRLDGRSHTGDLDHEIKLEFFYPVTERTWVFLSGKGVYEGELYRAGGATRSTRYLARDQAWIYFDRLAGSGFSLQAGRVNIAEPRTWWWDDDLDGVRVLHDTGPLHTELMLARERLRERSDEPDIDPEQDRVVRLMARSSWLWAPKQTLETFFLHARDRSGTPGEDATLPTTQEDPSDARLTWVGLRALGDRDLDGLGELRYWADAAWLRGREILTEYDDDAGLSTVDEVRHVRVRGHAWDLGLSWETRLPARPSLTLGYARASGDGHGTDDVDHAFRQTGLHNDKWRYHGVNRFRYYGELLRPELSNLSVSTLGLGFSLGNARSLDFVHHRYRQTEAARTLRDARVSAGLNGRSTDIGEEYDLILGSREWRHLDVALSGSMFRAGQAYGSKAGTRAWQIFLELTLNF